MKLQLAILLTLASYTSAETQYLLTTKEKVAAKKAEMLKAYMRSSENVDRLILYKEWIEADIRFRGKLFVNSVDVKILGADANSVIDENQVTRLESEIRETARQILKGRGFELSSSGEWNLVDITAYIIKPRPEENVHILEGTLYYSRYLLDERRGQSIAATLLEQKSLDYTGTKQGIGDMAKELCLRSLAGFLDRMCDAETLTQVYYELLSEGLIEKDFRPK